MMNRKMIVGLYTLAIGVASYTCTIIYYIHDGVFKEMEEKRHKHTGGIKRRQSIICENQTFSKPEWNLLCSSKFIEITDNMLIQGKDINVVQIGAHVGWERNDPICATMTQYLDLLSDGEKKKFHWTFVEPSPPNYEVLLENIQKYSYLCDMKSINAGVVSDSYNGTGSMPFYSVDESIDPRTGHDSRSNKTLPMFVTQLSSFDPKGINFNKDVFKRKGLDIWDYFHEVPVTITPYSDIMKNAISEKVKTPQLLLIDAQGFDCKIILGISESSPHLPEYLIYENNDCSGADNNAVISKLTRLGYTVRKMNTANTFANRTGNY